MAPAPVDRSGWRRAAAATLVAAVALVLVGALAGCGDGDDLPDDIAGVCEIVAERFTELQATPPSSWPEAEQRVEALHEIAADGDEALAGMGDRAPDPEAYAHWLEARRRVTARLGRALEAVRHEDPRAYAAARAAANRSAVQRRRLAKAAGLDACAAATGL